MSTGDLLLRVECYVAVRKALGYACRSEEKLLNNFVRFLEPGSPSLKGGGDPTQLQTSAPAGCSNQIPKVASGSSASLVRREDSRVRCPK